MGYESWYVASTGNHQGLIIDEGTGKNIAIAYDKEDAPLIAAAPEMFAALEAVQRLDYFQEHNGLADIVRNAIAKAKGE